MKGLAAIIGFILIASAAAAHTRTAVLAPGFASLKISGEAAPTTLPVLLLGQPGSLTLSFDELATDRRYLRASLVHCNADWTPSALADADFTDGFNSADITDYGFSTATATPYVNYRFRIGEEGLRPMASGNYLVVVTDSDDPGATPLVQARFCVAESAAGISGSVSPITDRGARGRWQQLEVRATVPPEAQADPVRRVRMVVERAGDENVAPGVEVRPSGVAGATLNYEHRPELIFEGGNEWRRFETVDMPGPGMHVDSVRPDGKTYHVWLTPDLRRDASAYDYARTQQGAYVVRRSGATDSDLAADYATVHFALRMPPLQDADVLLDGEFAQNLPPEALRMEYDAAAGVYRLALPLKQGSYNYRYLARPRGAAASPTALEGSHYQTANTYVVKTFVRTPSDRADRLASIALLASDPDYKGR